MTELSTNVGTLPKAIAKVMVCLPNREMKHPSAIYITHHTMFSPYPNLGTFVKSKWTTVSRKSAKLCHNSYVDSLSQWFENLPVDVKTSVPTDLIAKHVERHTNSFIEVGHSCSSSSSNIVLFYTLHRLPSNARNGRQLVTRGTLV